MIDWIDVAGASLRIARDGDGDRTMVLLHEMGGTLETWDAVVPRLSGFRILRFDQRGAGLSQKVDRLAFDDLVGDLGAVLDHVGIAGPVVLAGIAASAAVAAAFAARNPDRVEKLMLMSLAAGIPDDRRAAKEAIVAVIAGGGLRARIVQRLPATFPEPFRSDPARVRAFRGRALANDPASYAAWYRMLLGLDLEPDLRRIACPTLVLAGSADGTRPPERVAHDAALIPGAIVETVVSGHVMPALTPDLVADRLLRFAA